MPQFADRRAAGRLLAARLKGICSERTVVLALPRGGVPVGHEIAVALDVPLDVIVTRKIGYPPTPELGVGAIAESLAPSAPPVLSAPLAPPALSAPPAPPAPPASLAEPVFDWELLDRLGLTPASLAEVVAAEQEELARRVRVYRGGRPPPAVAGRRVIVVDDGLATGGTARAALRSLRAAGASSLLLAIPVAPPSAAEAMSAEADEVVILATPRRFASVGEWYASFGQLTDADVLELLGG
jgi:putative phosphoribosyl transferase